jgi:hypothetical protein
VQRTTLCPSSLLTVLIRLEEVPCKLQFGALLPQGRSGRNGGGIIDGEREETHPGECTE